nr:unnamed protein product [Spirometra erinaceieuropaei]
MAFDEKLPQEKALKATNYQGLQAALEWIVDNPPEEKGPAKSSTTEGFRKVFSLLLVVARRVERVHFVSHNGFENASPIFLPSKCPLQSLYIISRLRNFGSWDAPRMLAISWSSPVAQVYPRSHQLSHVATSTFGLLSPNQIMLNRTLTGFCS